MPGNEEKVVSFFCGIIEKNLNLNLPIIGDLKRIAVPTNDGPFEITTESDLNNFSSNDRYKKADIYLNGKGISLKEASAPLYNKIQRKHIKGLLNHLLDDPKRSEEILADLDTAIERVNQGSKRDIPWKNIFSKSEFYSILEFLMMEGYSDLKISLHPAELILIAPKVPTLKNTHEIQVFSFEKFFKEYEDKIVIAARRIWLGNKSKSENNRAKSQLKPPENQPWVYKNISGNPREWDPEFPKDQRREIFYLNINT